MPGIRVVVGAAIAFALWGGPASAKSVTTAPADGADKPGRVRTHIVKDGDSLWKIARSYGCMPQDLKRANRLASNLIHPGTRLKVPRSCKSGAKRTTSQGAVRSGSKLEGMLLHEVVSGDTLFKIAKKYDTSVEDLQLRNGLSGTMIRAGQRLDVVPGSGTSGRAIAGQSIGRAHRGRLESASRLGRGKGYTIRRPKRTYGANHAVYGIRRAIAVVRKRHPKSHTIAIGDLSKKKGGRLSGHRSHQSGRDVDVGLLFKKRPKRYPKEFVKATAKNLDRAATWTLVSAFAGMASSDNGVERIFLGYDTQKLLYTWAKKKGVSKKTLGRMFQYPHGRETPTGIIRHEPGHNDHLHVRFKCPKGDKACL